MKTSNLYTILAILLAGILIGTGVYFGLKSFGQKTKPVKLQQTEIQKLASDALKYINDNLLNGEYKAELVKAEQVDNLIKLNIKIGNYNYDSYITTDGKYLFPMGYDMTEKLTKATPESNSSQRLKKCSEVKKEKNPFLEVFVVSYCPFGLQAERAVVRAVEQVPELKNYLKIEYIGSVSDGKITSMHGDKEAEENLRQICLREEQPNKYWSYLSCFIKEGKSNECLSSAKVNQTKLSSCMNDENRGLKYAKADFSQVSKYNITGSPTFILNGEGEKEGISEFSFGGRSAESVKKMVCCGFQQEPKWCQKTADSSQAATGFSKVYSTESKD